MAPRGDHVVAIDEIPSPRWDLALELIEAAGRLTVLAGDPLVGLQRYDGWPGADGQIHVSIFTEFEPRTITPEMASRDCRAGLEQLGRALAADPRLQSFFAKYGSVYEYVYDYGNGAVCIGTVDAKGEVSLR